MLPHVRIALLLLAAACASDSPAPVSSADPDPQDRVAVAMSAAPADIGAAAQIMEFDSTGTLVELRPGTNGWLCLPDDNPAAPGDAPICVDEVWQQWFGAYMAGQPPAITRIGVSYMLRGSLAASNTDPFATTPIDGAAWLEDGPHTMIVVPDPASMLAGYPTEHSHTRPYVMWAGTPFAHLMVPTPTAGH